MNIEIPWLKEGIALWGDKAADYPTKALLYTAYRQYIKQLVRRELEEARLDGQIWSREEWRS